MKTLAVYSMKGGVGKTASAVNLAYLAASEGAQTLLCDLDPQGASSYYFRVTPDGDHGIDPLVKGKQRLVHGIRGSDYPDLDVLPSDFSYRHLDLVFDQAKKSKNRLKKALSAFDGAYDLVFLDCPPNLTLVSENAFQAADFIIHPTIPTVLAGRSLATLFRFFEREACESRILPFFSMVESRKTMHREWMERLRTEFPAFLSATIPYLSDIERMGVARKPVLLSKPSSAGSLAYRRLWSEIGRSIKG